MRQSGLTNLDPVHTGRIITTEKTGKGLKFASLLTVPILLIGVIVFCIGMSGNKPKDHSPAAAAVGFLMIIGSVGWLILIRFLTWWRHG